MTSKREKTKKLEPFGDDPTVITESSAEDKTQAVSNNDSVTKSDTEQVPSEFAQDAIKRLDPLELERFCRFEAEIRTRVQGMRIADLELLEIKRTLAAKAHEAAVRRQALETELNTRWKIGYDAFCMSLAEKYGIEKPAHILIDTDAGTIRDSSES